MKNSRFYRWISLLMIVLVFFSLGIFIISKDRARSSREQRNLVTLFDIELSGILTGEFENELYEYANDQFTLRNRLLDLRNGISVAMGEKEKNGIYRADDGYLIEGFKVPDMDNFEEQAAAVNLFAKNNSKLNCYVFIVPTASATLDLKLPDGAPLGDEKAYFKNWKDSLDSSITFIDVRNAFKNHAGEELFYKTDSRWTSLGAYYAYKEAAAPMQLNIANDRFEAMTVANDYVGPLCYESGYYDYSSDSISIYFNQDNAFVQVVEYPETGEKSVSMYKSEKLEGIEKLDVFFGGAHGQVNIETSSASDRNLLVIKDSNGDSFVPYLVNNFRRIVMIDPELYEGDINSLIRKEDFSDVLFLYQSGNISEDKALVKMLNGENVTEEGLESALPEFTKDDAANVKTPVGGGGNALLF
ncbi:MAG: DHHW family protein [Clostridiales bacterium]|nr:DHHW family protein [Clostridiales bacterium]